MNQNVKEAKKLRKVLLLFFVVCFAVSTVIVYVNLNREKETNLTYYVDVKKGDDANDGLSVRSAFQTIERAKAEVRTVNSSMTEDITVLIRGGDYPVSSAIEFSNEDSGTNGFYVNYRAYKDEEVRLIGGRQVTDWSLVDESKNIYQAYVGTEKFRQIYVDGEATVLARTPNMEDAKTGGPYCQALNNKYPFEIEEDLADDIIVGETEFVYIQHWNYMMAQIDHIEMDDETATVLFKNPQDEMAISEHVLQSVIYFFLQNAREYLDAPGEWYHDSEDGYLYYIPREGENMEQAEVIIPVAETLIDVTGKNSEAPANHITFSRLTFLYTNWNFPSSHGWFCTQEGQYPLYSIGHSGLVPGMVNLKYTSDIVLADNIFMNGGGCGIVSQPTSTRNQMIGNYFYNIASNAISLGAHESYMNDVEVINSSFESGDFSGWNNVFGCTVTDSENRGGNYAAMLRGTEDGSRLVRELDVKPETEYACSFWYNGEIPLQCSVQTADGTVITQDVMEQTDVDWIAMWKRTGGWDWKGSGLQFESGSNSKLYFVMENTSGTDVYVDDFNYDILKHYIEPYGASSHDTVSNNYIGNCASVYRDGCGIFALHPQYLKIIHNEISNMPYTGIGMGWAWDESITDCYGFLRSTHNNEIAYNRIYEVAQLLDDGAGVYILGRSDNTVVHHNYISDIQPSDYYGSNPVGGIYFDNGSMNKTAEYNVLDKVAMAFYAYNAPNHDNIIQNNYYNSGGLGLIDPFNKVIDNVKVEDEWPEEALAIMEEAGLEEEYRLKKETDE